MRQFRTGKVGPAEKAGFSEDKENCYKEVTEEISIVTL